MPSRQCTIATSLPLWVQLANTLVMQLVHVQLPSDFSSTHYDGLASTHGWVCSAKGAWPAPVHGVLAEGSKGTRIAVAASVIGFVWPRPGRLTQLNLPYSRPSRSFVPALKGR
ncbi:hypothetical protein CDAR_617161 [Caerostris darwini]|uniref:Secreted protein n=1 Tax=Caerostris darwini TaxID=1538125 RepID=A0AAV4NXF0_9ARAC|nr:hypothetical protein CDAR_617161 [Caerostris darwini]